MAQFYQVVLALHVTAAFSGFAVSLGLVIAAYRSRRTGTLSARFWRWQAVIQIVTLALGVLGASLYAMGGRPKVAWHLLYGAIALLTILIQWGLRPHQTLRGILAADYGRFNEVWVFFGLNLFLWIMYGRGLTTGLWGF